MKIARIIPIVTLLIISGFMLGNTGLNLNNGILSEEIIHKTSLKINNDSFVRGNFKKFIIIT